MDDMVRRVNVNFSDDAYEMVADLARQEDKTISGVLRDAIALKLWFSMTRQEGGRLLVERNGTTQEIIRV
jgi:hypothetical protein